MRVLLAVPAAVAGLLLAAPAGHATCVASLDWRGSSYLAYGGKDRAQLGTALRDKATRPFCDDTPTTPAPAEDQVPEEVEVHRFRGLPAAVAIHADSGGTYVNTATFVNLRSHPLHEQLGSNRRARTDGEPCTVEGVANVGGFGVSVAGRTVAVAVNTAVKLQRFGTGYVPEGTTIRVTGSCRDGWIDAKRIARA